MKKVVLSLGGSVLIPSLESNNISRYVPVLGEIARHVQLFIVVGGGGEARRYIGVARSLGIDEGTCDEIGIRITRLNAALLVGALGSLAYPAVAEDQTAAIEYAESGKIVVMGGITPAQTTDAVSAVLAERIKADLLVNATSVDGIYSADPKKDRNAVRYPTITASRLLEIVSGDTLGAGSNTVMDMVAVKVVCRSSIPLVVLDGRDPANLSAALLSGTFSGTIVNKNGKNPFPLADPAPKR
jgi:uridylate kinase